MNVSCKCGISANNLRTEEQQEGRNDTFCKLVPFYKEDGRIKLIIIIIIIMNSATFAGAREFMRLLCGRGILLKLICLIWWSSSSSSGTSLAVDGLRFAKLQYCYDNNNMTHHTIPSTHSLCCAQQQQQPVILIHARQTPAAEGGSSSSASPTIDNSMSCSQCAPNHCQPNS